MRSDSVRKDLALQTTKKFTNECDMISDETVELYVLYAILSSKEATVSLLSIESWSGNE